MNNEKQAFQKRKDLNGHFEILFCLLILITHFS